MEKESTIPPAEDTEPGDLRLDDTLDWDFDDDKPTQVVDMTKIMNDIDREQMETREKVRRHDIILPPASESSELY